MKIKDASAEYSGQILALMEAAFGSGYLTLEDIEAYIGRGVPFKYAAEGPRVIGTILFLPAGDEEIKAHTGMSISDIQKLRGGKKALICKCACTDPAYQNQGIARRLLRCSMDEIEKQGCGAVFTVLWKYNGKVPAENLFSEFQFERGEELAKPWYEEHSKYRCRVCGGPCRCSGIVFYKKI